MALRPTPGGWDPTDTSWMVDRMQVEKVTTASQSIVWHALLFGSRRLYAQAALTWGLLTYCTTGCTDCTRSPLTYYTTGYTGCTWSPLTSGVREVVGDTAFPPVPVVSLIHRSLHRRRQLVDGIYDGDVMVDGQQVRAIQALYVVWSNTLCTLSNNGCTRGAHSPTVLLSALTALGAHSPTVLLSALTALGAHSPILYYCLH
jgi:hypothetical protein